MMVHVIRITDVQTHWQNYNALATDEDDSHEYPISGCIDQLSCITFIGKYR